jgi:5-methylcytosine-specific restriction endonuclease McrA
VIRIDFKEPGTPAWIRWKEQGDAATKKLKNGVLAGVRPKFNEKLYKRMRKEIYEAFHGKCAYCERKFILDQSGDIDHFRPKGAVTNEQDQPVMIPGPGSTPNPHPGYYWLAYRWENLLPTCAKCNRPAKLESGKLVGKSTRFPVQGQHVWEPGKEAQESPLFVHPVFDNPTDHLRLEVSTGVIFAKTPRGELTIDLLDLNREGLPEERCKRYTEIKGRVMRALNLLALGQVSDFASELATCLKYKRGEEELSWAAQISLDEEENKLKPLKLLFDF